MRFANNSISFTEVILMSSCKSASKINGDGKSFWVWFPTKVRFSSSPGCADQLFFSLNLLPEEHAELFLWQKRPKREANHSSPFRSDAVRWIRRIVAGLIPERPELGPGQFLVKFISYNVALGRGFSPNSSTFCSQYYYYTVWAVIAQSV